MLKKLVALLTSGALVVGAPIASLAESDFAPEKLTTTKQTMAREFLESMGMLPGFENKEYPITRAEFTAMVVDLAGVHMDESAPDFADVSSDSEYYTEIQQARSAGLIGGGDDNTFSPDEPIDFDAACKISTAVLGYDYYAGRNGGYPAGYIKAADEADVMTGSMFTNGYLYADNALLIGYNLLHADPFEWDQYETKPILEGEMGLDGYEGILQSASNESISDNPFGADYITVDGFSYKLNDRLSDNDYTSYIGSKVEYWVDEDSTVVAIARMPQNEIVTINDDSAEISFDGTTLEVYEDGAKKVKYKVSSSCLTAYNGRSSSIFEEDEDDFAGKIRMVDNDHDGRYDSVMVYEAQYMLVGSVNLVDNQIVDKNNELKIKINEDTDYTLFGYDETGALSKISWEDITAGEFLEIYASNDDSYVNIYASALSFEGTIEGSVDDKINISGSEYRTTAYYDKYYAEKTHPGMNVTVALTSKGRIGAIISTDVISPVYGYLLKAYVDTDDETMKVMVMDKLGNHITYSLADKFTLDNVRVVPTGDEAKAALFDYDESGNKHCKFQVIRYVVNADGEISIIDTADTSYLIESSYDENGFAYPLERFTKTPDNSNNSLTQMISKKTVVYSNNGIAMPYFPIGSAIMFSVPDTIRTDPYSDVDLEDFGIYGSMEHEHGYNVDAFDYDENFCPRVVVVYNTDLGATSNESDAVMVSEVVNAVNAENEVSKRITIYDGSSYNSYFVSTSKLDSMIAKGTIPKKGDVVRINVDNNSEITAISIDLSFDPVKRSLKRGSEVVSNLSSRNSYASGTVYNNVGNTILLYSPGTAVAFSTSNSVSVSSPVNGLYALRVSVNNIIMYDTETNTVRSAKSSEIKNMVNSGDDASIIAMRYRSTQNNAVFLFN